MYQKLLSKINTSGPSPFVIASIYASSHSPNPNNFCSTTILHFLLQNSLLSHRNCTNSKFLIQQYLHFSSEFSSFPCPFLYIIVKALYFFCTPIAKTKTTTINKVISLVFFLIISYLHFFNFINFINFFNYKVTDKFFKFLCW